MTLLEIKSKLEEIRDRGWIKSLRKGTTGVGYTFESIFGVAENNIPVADIGGRVEIKTVRKDSSSLITLFTFNKSVWKVSQREIIERYGYIDNKGRLALKNTLFVGRDISQGLTLYVDWHLNTVDLVDVQTEEVLAEWDVYVIVGKFMTKMSRLLFVLADRKTEDGVEYFHYNEAYLLSEPDSRAFLEAFEKGIIGIDLRMHIKENGSVRNRGTAFRVKEVYLKDLYRSVRRLL